MKLEPLESRPASITAPRENLVRDDGRQVRIGVVFPGDPQAPSTWSGTPAGLSGGLQAAGVDVVAICAQPRAVVDFVARNLVACAYAPRVWRPSLRQTISLGRKVARISTPLSRLYTQAAGRAVRGGGSLDGLIQIGTGYALPDGSHYVTYEDLTIAQALGLGYPDWRGLTRRAVEAALERQRRAYRGAVACCLTTPWAAESVVRDYGIAREKVHAVGLGRNYVPPAATRDWSTPRYLFVGRDWEGKNGTGLLRAFARVKAEIPAARLDIVGNHPPIDADGVTGHGFLHLNQPADRERAERLYQSATCFVLPSHYEASAIAYIEAGSAGLPCIGTTRGGSADLIGDGGVMVDPGDDDALVAAMLALASPETAARIGELGRSRSALFTWRAVAERILRALALPAVPTDSLAEFLEPPATQAR